ncbi:MAG: PDZ domain-containing protein [Planctomycetota bacterium]|nr:PDZ domain-containing protein [Planctomycetota bacterium]MDP6956095.1 PDZ domain-containing protein [Planctomycetota bacterium]
MGTRSSRRLTPVGVDSGSGSLDDARKTRRTPQEWRACLMEQDLTIRERSFADLRATARAAGEASALWTALESWTRPAADAADGERELAWTARLLLGELRRCCASCGHDGSGQRRGLPQWFEGSGADPFAELREQMQRLHGMRGNLGSHGSPEDYAKHGQRPGIPGELGAADGGQLGEDARPPSSSGHGLQLEVGPGGVRVRLQQIDDGQSSERVFEAPSLEELLQAHPELRGRLGGGPGQWSRDVFRLGFSDDGLAPTPGSEQTPERPLRVDILGVLVQRVSEESPGLEDDRRGLVVDRVVKGTIAAVIGLRRGDRLLTINGEALERAADVTRLLAARPPGGELRVVWFDSRERRCERTWRESGPRPEGPQAPDKQGRQGEQSD